MIICIKGEKSLEKILYYLIFFKKRTLNKIGVDNYFLIVIFYGHNWERRLHP